MPGTAQHRTGLDTIVGIGTETVYGTRVVPTTFLPITNETLQPTKDFVSSKPLMGGVMVQPEGLHRESGRGAEGALELELYDRGMGKMFNLLHGEVVAIETPDDATLARRQVHKIGKSSPIGKSLTCQVQRASTNNDLNPFDYIGLKATEAVIHVAEGEAATIQFTFDGRDELTDQTNAVPTYVTVARPFTFSDCALLLAGVLAANVREATITIPLGMATDRRHLGNSGVKDEPLLNEHSDITVEATFEFRTMADHNRYKAGLPVSLEFNAVGAEIEAGFNHELNITAASAKQISPVNGPSGGPDILTSEATFEVKWNGTDYPLEIETISTDTAL